MATIEDRRSRATHAVANQAPPLEDYNSFEQDRPLAEALQREGGGWARDRARDAGRAVRLGQGDPPRGRGQREAPRAAHPRPLRPPHRRGRLRQLLARADVDRGLPRPSCAALARARARRPCRPGGAVHAARPGRRWGRLPDLHDLLGDPGIARPAGGRRGVGGAAALALLRPALRAGGGEERRTLRDGDDREAGRLRRARQHHCGDAAQRGRSGRRVRDHRPQVVLLGADVRRLPRPWRRPRRASPAS